MGTRRTMLSSLNLFVALLAIAKAKKVFPVDDQGKPLPGALRTIYVDPEHLWTNRDYYRNGYPQLNTAVNRVLNRVSANESTWDGHRILRLRTFHVVK